MDTQSYEAGLAHERAGYEAKVRQAETAGDDAAKARYATRIRQIDAEATRLRREGITPETATAGGARERATRRGRGQSGRGQTGDEN